MRLTIQNQIILPLILIQGLAIGAMSVASATSAAARAERQLIERLDGVAEVLRQSNFPYTDGVLSRMKGLSGAEYVVLDTGGKVAAASEPGLRDARAGIDRLAGVTGPSATSRVDLGGVPYFAVPLSSPAMADSRRLVVLYPEEGRRQAQREAAAVPLAMGAVALSLMIATTSVIARRMSRRLRGLGREVARIAGGDFAALDAGRARDEIADLADSVNAMCLRLREMSDTLRRGERTRVLAQLAAGLAHQLRNSLTGARMSVQLHARRVPACADDPSLAVALRQLTITEEQVKGLLSLGRVETRPPTPCDVRGLLDDVALLVGPACEHTHVALEVGPTDAGLRVTAEKAGLRAAVLNLTLNAVEAAGPGGSVRLGASREDGAMTFSVSDTGPGPSSDVAGSILDPFVTGKPEGVGLGLALAREVAERHAGTLDWTREDGMTHFRLTIPLSPADPEAR